MVRLAPLPPSRSQKGPPETKDATVMLGRPKHYSISWSEPQGGTRQGSTPNRSQRGSQRGPGLRRGVALVLQGRQPGIRSGAVQSQTVVPVWPTRAVGHGADRIRDAKGNRNGRPARSGRGRDCRAAGRAAGRSGAVVLSSFLLCGTHPGRFRAETPLIPMFRFPEPALYLDGAQRLLS
jgi:hypothetical protein